MLMTAVLCTRVVKRLFPHKALAFWTSFFFHIKNYAANRDDPVAHKQKKRNPQCRINNLTNQRTMKKHFAYIVEIHKTSKSFVGKWA